MSQGHPFSCKYWRAGKCPLTAAPQHVYVLQCKVVLSRPLQQSYTPPGKQRSCITLVPQLHQEVQRLSRMVETVLRRCPTGLVTEYSASVRSCPGTRRSRTCEGTQRQAWRRPSTTCSPARGLRRVLTHCTWEKTTVAISKCGSKVGRYASSVCMSFLSCMVTVRGGE